MTAEQKWEALREKLEMLYVADQINEARGAQRIRLFPADMLRWMREFDLDAKEKADE